MTRRERPALRLVHGPGATRRAKIGPFLSVSVSPCGPAVFALGWDVFAGGEWRRFPTRDAAATYAAAEALRLLARLEAMR